MPELAAIWARADSCRTALTYGRKTVNGRVIGTNAVYGEARKHYPKAGGRFLTPDDEDEKRRVIFLGDEMAKDIFGKEEPVGKTLLVNNSPFTVIGVMQKKTQIARLRRPGPEPRGHPESDVQGRFRPRPLNVLVIRARRRRTWTRRSRALNEIIGRQVRLRPDGRARLGRLEHGQGPEEEREDLPRHGDVLRHHRRR